jgi:hypothetical protein
MKTKDRMAKEVHLTLRVLLLLVIVGAGSVRAGICTYFDDTDLDADWNVNICPSGSALEFDGGDDYIEVPYDDSLAITDEITIGAWVNIANAVGAGQHYVVDSRDGTGGGYGLNVDTELIQFSLTMVLI